MSTSAAKVLKQRPKHLDLMKIRLPLPGWVSIMHRASGAVLFIALPLLLWLLDKSLTTEIGFESLREILSQAWVKLVLAALLWGYLHHFCAGIRYLMLDMHKGIDLASARMSAGIVYVVSIPLTALIAWRLFL
jgi:succinate dehydrogenase / fumarate reductase cytochrome b subunit